MAPDGLGRYHGLLWAPGVPGGGGGPSMTATDPDWLVEAIARRLGCHLDRVAWVDVMRIVEDVADAAVLAARREWQDDHDADLEGLIADAVAKDRARWVKPPPGRRRGRRSPTTQEPSA